jgi:hypothetical protein
VGDPAAATVPEPLGPVPSRIYETAAGPLHVVFTPTTAVLAAAPADGWFPMLNRERPTPRSGLEIVRALVRRGVSAEEAGRLSSQILADWRRVEVPAPRTRRQELFDALRVAALLLRLLVRMPRSIWELLRDREEPDGEARSGFVPPASTEYGVIRLVKTSRGWVQFEFWGHPTKATVGVYGEDGWLRMRNVLRHLDCSELAEALRSEGCPGDEAEHVANLVLGERRARLRGETSSSTAGCR